MPCGMHKVLGGKIGQGRGEEVRAKKLPVAYVTFGGEQHGFRKAENIERALEAELSF